MTDLGVSVIIPTFRRPAMLKRCLQEIISQHEAPPYEVIVCDDDGPNSELNYYCVELSARSGINIAYLPITEIHGPAAARNAGAAVAKKDILAFTDDDCLPAREWLKRGARRFADPTISAVTGRMVVPLPEKPTDYERNEAGMEKSEFVSANLFCRRNLFWQVGGFDTLFRTAWREDSDLHFKLIEAGAKIVKEETAVVYHPVRPGSWGISLLQQRKVLFDALLYKKHPRLYRERINKFPVHYYVTVAFFFVGLTCLALGAREAAALMLSCWLIGTLNFVFERLKHTTKDPLHVTEMLCTSLVIPFASIFWRLRGAIRYRVWFA